jgi:hypothetical protein
MPQLSQGIHRCLDYVDDVSTALRLGEYITHANSLQHGPHTTARDHTSPRRGWFKEHSCASTSPHHFVRNRGLHQRYRPHLTPRPSRRLTNRIGNTTRLADSQSDPTTVIAYNRNYTEVKATASLDNLCNPRDIDDTLVQFLSIFEDLTIS